MTFETTYYDPAAQIAQLSDAVWALRKVERDKLGYADLAITNEWIALLETISRIREANWPAPIETGVQA